MADLKSTIQQAISDFDAIEAAIEESGVDVPFDTNTSEYGNKVRAVYNQGLIDGAGGTSSTESTDLYVVGTFTGNGNATKTYNFDFEPKCVMVWLKNYSPFKYDSVNNYTICSYGVAFSNGGYSLGLSLSGTKLTINQSSSATNGIFTNLNTYLGQYQYIAFK